MFIRCRRKRTSENRRIFGIRHNDGFVVVVVVINTGNTSTLFLFVSFPILLGYKTSTYL